MLSIFFLDNAIEASLDSSAKSKALLLSSGETKGSNSGEYHRSESINTVGIFKLGLSSSKGKEAWYRFVYCSKEEVP